MKPYDIGCKLITFFFWYSVIVTVISNLADKSERLKYTLLILIPGFVTILLVEFIIPWLSIPELDEWKWSKKHESSK